MDKYGVAQALAFVGMVYFGWVFINMAIENSQEPNYFQEMCEDLTPEGYVLVSNYTLDLHDYGACKYESSADKPYDVCFKEFEKTELHGQVMTLCTCPWGCELNA